MKKNIFYLILSLFLIFSCAKKIKIELYSIKYGDSLFPTSEIYYNDKLNKEVSFSWLFYLIKYNGHMILIDTGFNDEKYIEMFKINFKSPLTLLEELNIEPENITDIIITHSHFDHIGNIDKFPNARIYIQKDEFENFKKDNTNENLNNFINENNKIIAFNDSYVLFDIFKITKIGGHSIGSSAVSFNYLKKDYFITGDECYLYYNYINQKPVGAYYNIKNNISFLKDLQGDNKIILTFHEPLIHMNSNRIKKITPGK